MSDKGGMKVAIVGSRYFGDLEKVRALVRELPKGSTVVSGGASGVDQAAEEEARKHGLNVIVHRALWHKYGKSAGPIRNQKIVEDADELHAFWNSTSRGTKSAIVLARAKGIHVVIHED